MANMAMGPGGMGGNMPIMPPLTAAERAARSVFVGNIPYEATEEQLKEIFMQAGPVVSFRLVYDRETGKPKGYGFCEYQDLETAQSAMRNLNNYDFNGRPLRVGVAAGESNKDEMKGLQQAMGGPLIESPYGDPVEPEKAPEAISKAVASLPPEQMFELMKQMKMCIQNNPTEARNMLLQNPQLAYALLQAQIVMKIVDPQVAMAMLHRETNQIPPTSVPSTGPVSVSNQVVKQQQAAPSMPGMNAGGNMGPVGPPMSIAGPSGIPNPISVGPPSSMQGPMPGQQGPRMGGPGMGPGPRMGGPVMGPGPEGMMGGPMMGQVRPNMGGQMGGQIGGPMGGPVTMGGPNMGPTNRDPRMMPSDPRSQPTAQSMASAGIPSNIGSLSLPGGMPNISAGGQISAQDQEKAALIMQVLQLTDQQIAMLPPDQRQSILYLKEQISKSQ